MDHCKVLEGKMSWSTGGVSSPPQRTKLVRFVEGYVHSIPRFLHLKQCGICFPHLRLAVAQGLHAFVSDVVTICAADSFHNECRKIGVELL